MATTPKVLLKRSSVIGRAPQPSDLQYGEIAINFADGKLYYKDANNNINAFIDSARVQAIAESVSALAESQLDSGEVIALIDSAYVQQRQDYDWNSLENIPSYVIGLDSAEVIRITLDSSEVIALIDSSHVRARQDYAYASLTGKPNILDSADIAILTLDSDEIKAFINSEYIRSFIDKTFIDGLNVNADTLDGQEGSYYSNYNNLTNKPLILDNIDVSNIITNDVDKAFVDALNVDADTLDGLNSTQFLRSDQSDSMRGSLTVDSNITVGGYIAGPETFYIDPAGVGDNTGRVVIRGDLQVDGTQTIVNSTTVSINDKNIVLADSAQNAAEADGAGITVNGANATITYNAANDEWQFNKDVQAPNIEATTIVATTITGEYTGFDSDFALKTTTDLTEGDNLYYTTARADSDFDVRLATKTTTDVAEGNNLYYTKARVDSDISQNVTKSFVDALNIDADTLDGQSGIFYLDHNNFINAPDIPAIVRANSVDSGEVINLVDSAYVQQRQDYAYTSLTGAPTNVSHFTNDAGYLTDTDTLDSEEAQGIIDSNFQNLTQSIIPANNNIDLGTLTNRFRDLYLGGNSLYIGNIKVTDSNGQIAFRDLSGNRVDISTLDPQVVALVDSAYVQARVDTAYIETLIDQVYLDSDDAIQLVDSAYVQQRQDYAYASLTGVPTNVSHFTNDANYLDSSTVTGVINNTYIANTIDSSTVTNIINNDITVFTENVDSAYIRFRQDYRYSSLTGVPDIDALTVDSAEVIALVDSAYVQQRMGTTTNLPEGNNLYYVKSRVDSDIAAAFTDSAAAVNVTINNYVQDTVDSAYVLARVAEAPFLDSADAIQLIDSAYVKQRVKTDQDLLSTSDVTFNTVTADDFIGDLNGAVRFIGRANVDMSKGQVVYVTGVQGNTSTIDLARANNSSTMPAMGFVSADVSANNNVEVVTFGNLQNLNIANFGETGITFGPNDTVYVSASEAGHVTNVKPSGESNLIQNIGRIQRHTPTSNMAIKVGGAGRTNATPNLDADQFFLGNDSNYSVATDFTAAVTNVVDSAFVKQRVATDQDLRTTDSVTFSGLTVSGNLTVSGTQSVINTEVFKVIDPLIHLGDSNNVSDIVDIGFIGKYYADGKERHTGLVRDASNGEYYLYTNSVDSASDSVDQINLSAPGFTLATLNAGNIIGQYQGFDSDFGTKTTSNLTEGSNLYYTTARHDSDFDIRLATKSTSNLAEGSNLYYTTARHDSDTLVQVDSGYVRARVDKSFIDTLNIDADTLDGQSGLFYLDYNNFINVPNVLDSADIQAFTVDSAEVIALIDSAYIQARQDYAYSSLTGAPNVLDSANVISLVDSAYIELRRPAETIFTVVNNGTSAYTFTGDGFSSGRDNPTLYLTRGKTYKFGMSASGHPFQIRVSDGGSAYNTGVTNNGAQTGDIFFTPDMNAPTSLVYQCTVHSGMVGDIVILDNTDIFRDSAFVTGIIDSAYIQLRQTAAAGGTDSATVISLITSTVDSAYISALGFGTGGGTVDSADIIAIVDSAYVQARQLNETAAPLTQTNYNFTATLNQTVFGGMVLESGKFQVYLNGLLLPQADYTSTSSTVTLTVGANTGDVLEVIKFSGNDTGAQAVQQRHYIYTATSGQTVFTGADDNSATLSYTQGRINVYLNGLLLLDSADYTQNSNGDTVTFTSGVTAGHIVNIQTLSGNTGSFAPLEQTLYEFTADSGQTIFTGADNNAAALDFSNDKITVYLNGILLSGNDYTPSSGNTITLDVGADSGNLLTVAKLSGNNIGLDSAQVNALIGASGPSGVDSAAIIALVDSAYVQARQTTGGSGTVDSAGVNTLINNYIIDADTALTTTTANQVVDTFSASTYRTAKYIIQMSHSSGYHSNEILLVHDGSTVYMTTYAEIITASSLGTIDADINSGNVRLLVTPTNTNTDINITRINVDV